MTGSQSVTMNSGKPLQWLGSIQRRIGRMMETERNKDEMKMKWDLGVDEDVLVQAQDQMLINPLKLREVWLLQMQH